MVGCRGGRVLGIPLLAKFRKFKISNILKFSNLKFLKIRRSDFVLFKFQKLHNYEITIHVTFKVLKAPK